MNCYRCRELARYRLVATRTSRLRRLLRLGPREWHTCAEHRMDPIPARPRHRRPLRMVVHHD